MLRENSWFGMVRKLVPIIRISDLLQLNALASRCVILGVLGFVFCLHHSTMIHQAFIAQCDTLCGKTVSSSLGRKLHSLVTPRIATTPKLQ